MNAGNLFDEIEGWCGTKTPGPHLPHPHALSDLLVSVAIYQLAAKISDASVREQIQGHAQTTYAAAGRIIATGAQTK
jgi:3-dehydroquinate dehydratase